MKQRSPSSAFFWLAVICCVAAIAIHAYLTKHHLDLQYGISDGNSLCNINDKLDCDSVNTSVYSEIFGTPIALWGVVANAAILLLLFWAKATRFQNSHLSRICFFLGSGIGFISLVMLVISFTQLGTFCLFCIGTYVASFGLFLGVWRMVQQDISAMPSTVSYLFTRGDNGGFSYLIYLAMIPVFVFVLNGMLRSRFGDDFKQMVSESVGLWQTNPSVNLDVPDALNLKRTEDNYKMHIVEFADFNCGHCKRAAPTLHAFAKSRKDVQLTFLNFPLDGGCNPAIKGPGESCALAKATICGKAQNKGWEVHDWLFENQTQVNMEKMISTLKLEPTSFNECLNNTATHESVFKQASLGQSAGIKGTPSIYVNGRLLNGGQFIPVLTEVYNHLGN